METLLTVAEVALIMKLKEQTVRKMAQRDRKNIMALLLYG
jgi:hypothetical protein